MQPSDRSRFAVFNRTGLTIEKLLWSGLFAQQRKTLGFSPASEFDEFMVDLYLLGRADGLVGSFTGNLDRLAYALMAGYATPPSDGSVCLKPYVSLGAYWCNDHGVRSGVSTTGQRFDC